MNRFKNVITCHQGRQVSVMLKGGRIIEGKAIVDSCGPLLLQKDGTFVAPLNEADVTLVWPQFYTHWIDAEEYGDNAFHDLDGSREWAFLMAEDGEDFQDEEL